MARKITVVINANDAQAKPTFIAIEASASRIANVFNQSNKKIESSSNSTSKNVQKGFGNAFSTIDKQAQKTAKQSASAFDKQLNSSYFSKLGREASSAFKSSFSMGGFGGGSGGVSGILGTAIGIAGGNLLTSAIGSVTGAMSSGVKAGFDYNSMQEKVRLGYEVMLGGADNARQHMRELSDFAEKAPLDLPQVYDGSQRLLAMGFAAKEVIPTLRAVTDAVAGQGKVGGEAAEATNRITLARESCEEKTKDIAAKGGCRLIKFPDKTKSRNVEIEKAA